MKDTIDIKDLNYDDLNFNKGTAEGREMLKKSLSRLKAGRSILVDKNNNIIAGNKTAEVAEELGMKVHIIESDGTKLVVVQRTDLSIDSKEGREMSLADNAVSASNIAWDTENLAIAAEQFEDFNIEAWGVDINHNTPDVSSMGEINVNDFDENQILTIKLTAEQYDMVVSKLHEYGEDLTEALLFYCGYYE